MFLPYYERGQREVSRMKYSPTLGPVSKTAWRSRILRVDPDILNAPSTSVPFSLR